MTLHDDLAIRLEQLRHERGVSFKAAINDMLRAGLETVHGPPEHRAMADRMGAHGYTEPLHGRLLTSVEEAVDAAETGCRGRKDR